MIRFYKSIWVLISIAILAGCQTSEPNNQLMIFLNDEKGLQPYQTRIIVTPKLIRLDDGEASKSYTIFDRKTRIARSVDTEQHTVLIINPKTQTVAPPFKLEYQVKDLGDIKDAPKVIGKDPKHYQQYVNNKLCFDVITVDGLMPQAVTALKQYHEMLASDSMVTVNNLPADMQDPCELAMHTFAPTLYLQHGFPVQEWRPGLSRMLVDYKQHYAPDPKLFEIPKDYFTYTIQQIREGLVDMDNRKIITPPDQQSH